jgi:hypothetical protein
MANPEPTAANPPHRGEIVLMFAFDVANEIATARVGELLTCVPTRFSVRTDRKVPSSLPLYQPLEIIPAMDVRVNGSTANVSIRVYDVGVVAITLRIPHELPNLNEARRFFAPVLEDGRTTEAWATEVCASVCRDLQPAMIRPSATVAVESYTVFCLTELGGERDTHRWLDERRREIASLLCDSDADRLSEMQVAETLSLERSFDRTDLVVICWDAALIVDLSGSVADELYVLELANLQLCEFRVMDQLLDQHLNAAYTDLDQRPSYGWGRVPPVLRGLRRVRVELTQLADQVTHITKFIGDWYLARVYLAAHERFALDRWRASVEARLTQLDQVYAVMQNEVHEQRMMILEVAIVLLFIFDILAIFIWK